MVYNRDLSQRLFFAAVAIFSFTGNLFFIVLIVRNRKLMKNAYHVILLSLAITDMMTGGCIKRTFNSALSKDCKDFINNMKYYIYLLQ